MTANNQFNSLLRALKKVYTEEQKIAVWNKGRWVKGYNPAYVRADACGALIEWKRYSDTGSIYGWEIDHIIPESLNGSDAISNLQPLQWQNNRTKGDSLAPNYCVVRG